MLGTLKCDLCGSMMSVDNSPTIGWYFYCECGRMVLYDPEVHHEDTIVIEMIDELIEQNEKHLQKPSVRRKKNEDIR